MKNSKLKIKNCLKSGFSLLETMVAITILMTSIVGPLALASKGIVFADYVKNEITGFYLAQEALEAIRNIRDANIKNAGDWLAIIKDKCMSSDGKLSEPCRIDIWNFDDPLTHGLKKCNETGAPDQASCERLKVVEVGSGANRVKLYGYDFKSTITAGNEPEDSIFSRKIIITNITEKYLDPDRTDIPDSEKSYLQLDPSGIDEINVRVEVSWLRGDTVRFVQVSENMFSI